MRDPIRHLKALAFAVTVFLITSFALAQIYPQVFPFMPYVWPYVTGGSLTYAGTDLEIAPAAQFSLQETNVEQQSHLRTNKGKWCCSPSSIRRALTTVFS